MTTARPNPQGTLSPAWDKPLGNEEEVSQLVNRITFGPRPGDLEHVRSMRLEAFVEEQFHPERLNDSAVEARLATLPTLTMPTSELIEKYPVPKQMDIEQAAAMKSQGGDAGMMTAGTVREVLVELGREQILRAIYSTRQLQEVMVQFWMNHFNIFAGKGPDKWLLTSFERDTIRPRALGNFEDLLVATAQSPAMQFYLDNWLSSAPRQAALGGFGRSPVAANQANQMKRGLNENYGRELMELHTLGVNGGYTQQDVVEVARCLTGWTLRRPRQEAEFFFDPRLHDDGPKTVVGHAIAAGGGMADGLQVLHILATHPSTARFVSTKLCRRFVADDPPATLVDRTSREFLRTHGDLRAVLKSILTSPEFHSEGAFRAKVKSPLEMVASTLRALDAQTDAGMPLLGFMGRMGEPMFQYQAPAGLPDCASTWVSSSSLLARLNFAMLVTANRISGTEISWKNVVPEDAAASPGESVDKLSRLLTGTTLSGGSRKAILDSFGKAGSASVGTTPAGLAPNSNQEYATLPTLAGLVIGSPEFQRR